MDAGGNNMTVEEAFAAMFEFLRAHHEEFQTANVADVLGDLQPAYDGQSSRPRSVGRLPAGRSDARDGTAKS